MSGIYRKAKRDVSDRKGIIGGSDAGALLGYSTYRTPYDVWLSWKGMAPEPDAETRARFDMGHELEGFIARQTERIYGCKLRRDTFAHYSAERPWLICHPDRIAWIPDGRRIAVEIKSSSVYTNSRWGAPDTDEVPYDYLVQCLMYWYTGVTDADEMWLMRFSDNRLSRYVIRRDDALIASVADEIACIVEEKWMKGEAPQPGTYAQAVARYPASGGGAVMADARTEVACETYRVLLRQRKAIDEAIDEAKASFISYMGGAETLVGRDGSKLLTYKAQTRQSIDTKALKAECPEIAEKYTRTSTVMVLR